MTPRKLSPLLVAVLALLFGLSACGSDGSSSTASTTVGGGRTQSTPAPKPSGDGGGGGSASRKPAPEGKKSTAQAGKKHPEEPAFEPPPHHDSGGGAKQFEVKGGDNSIQEFGGDSSGPEFAEAAAALHAYLDARAAHAWSAACGYLSATVSRSLAEGFAESSKASCAEVLAGLSAGVPEGALREAAVADVGALRVEGDRAFLLFKGAHGVDYFIPMAREGGAWKVAAIAPSALS